MKLRNAYVHTVWEDPLMFKEPNMSVWGKIGLALSIIVSVYIVLLIVSMSSLSLKPLFNILMYPWLQLLG